MVEQLPPSQRAVILLGELRGLSDREMADALGITLGAAKIRLHRARRALKVALERAAPSSATRSVTPGLSRRTPRAYA